ncbi:sensor domain-containing protein [Sulfuricurvum sp.]|uniref:sensor domain-containing protein n=1 Tax=Sulfuricurvum sp. TaxID=2025608 RepID=UPI002E355290|nr:EAL domain-containing protein [Sulfuricurvum sp.]HEX5328753.1 EAL domain-containing protein [Sulfuricurvum sp.]
MSRRESHSNDAKLSHYYHAIFDNCTDIIYLVEVTPERRFIHIDLNSTFTEITGLSKESILSHYVDTFSDAELRRTLIQKYTSCLTIGEKINFIGEYNLPGGKRIYYSSLTPIRDEHGRIYRIAGIARDITEQKEQEDHLRKTQAKLAAVISTIPDMIWVKDANGVYLMCNPALEHFFGVPAEEIIGKTDFDFMSQEQADVCRQNDIKAIETGTISINEEEVIFASSGQCLTIETRKIPVLNNDEFMGVLGIGRDISERKAIDTKIEYLAHHDALTGLPNRILVKERAEQIMAHAKRSGTKAAFLFIDLDGFKGINDTLGHSAGDAMLKTIALRLKECVRESDTISRQGGDEFLLILSDVKDPNATALTAEKILKELEKSFEVATHTLSASGSIGIALYPDHGETFETLLQSADTAMYKAKESGRNAYCFYSQQMNHNLIGQFKIQNDLKSALLQDQFLLHYQPQIDLSSNRIIGVEALIRWNHPQLGMIPPMSFIPIAESNGLIAKIGQWVIDEACRQAALWQEMGIELTVAVNISAVQFKRGNLEEVVSNALSTSKINPKYLELELTESIIMHDADNTLASVRNLKALGVQLSIDDFGTGYSSLAYLKRFSVDKLKIDQSFVRDILQDKEDATIVKTIIQMAKNLNLKTIAEGVEDLHVLSVIDAYGCDEVQGYHFAKPMKNTHFEEYYKNFYAV